MKQCIGVGLRGPEGLGSIIRDRTRHSPASASSREKEKIEEEEEKKNWTQPFLIRNHSSLHEQLSV